VCVLQAHEGAQRIALFHEQQQQQWAQLSDTINSYVESVRDLAEKMAVNGERQEHQPDQHMHVCLQRLAVGCAAATAALVVPLSEPQQSLLQRLGLVCGPCMYDPKAL